MPLTNQILEERDVNGVGLLLVGAAVTMSILGGRSASAHADGELPSGVPGARLSGLPVPGFAGRSLEAVRFRALHAAVRPRGQGERWTAIP